MISACATSATAGTRHSGWPLTCNSPRRCNVDLVEFIGGSPYVDGILEEPFVLDADGYLPIPDVPGLGVRLSREKLSRFTPDAGVLFA